MMLELTVSNEFDFLSPDFATLFDRADATAFQHPLWQSAMQDHLRNFEGMEERTLLMHCASSGELVGLLPLIARKTMGVTVLEYANMGLVDYAMPTMHRDILNWMEEPGTVTSQLRDALGPYDILRIKHMPRHNRVLEQLFPGGTMVAANFSSYATELSGDYQSWRQAAISKSERRHRDKKRRAMLRNGEWHMQRLYDRSDIAEAMDAMRRFHKDRYADRAGEDMIQNPDAYRFYVDLAATGAQSGFTRIYRFTYEGEIAAVQFGLSHARRYYYLMMGIDYDRIGKHSPGLLMTEDVLEDCIRDGYEMFDLTVGDEPYKLKFGTTPAPVHTFWHAHSLLGSMGCTAAVIAQTNPLAKRLISAVR